MAESQGCSHDVDRWPGAAHLSYRLLRRLAPVIALVVLLLPPAGSAAASGSGVTNFYRLTYQDATNAANAARYQFMGLGYSSGVRSLIASIHRADPHTRTLLYKTTGAEAVDTQGINGCKAWNHSQPYGGIPASWFLKDAKGIPLYDPSYGYYALDPGNSQVQQACLSSAISLAKQAGYDGIFWDMVSTSLFWAGISPGNCSSTSCQSDANWHAAIASFVTHVSAGLHAQGLLSIGNIAGGAIKSVGGGPTYWQAFQQDGLDGAQEESFTSGNNHLPVPPTQWKLALANEAWNEANGKYFLGNGDVAGNEALNTYGLATLLLAAQGRSSWSTADGNYGSGEYWFPEYDTALKLGQPLGAYSVQCGGLYVRRFQNGTVIVNPATSAVSDPVYGHLGAQSGLIEGGPPRSAATISCRPPTTNPPPKKKSKKKKSPKLSVITYAGRGIRGVQVYTGQAAFFSATASDPGGGRLTYRWNWGDGRHGCAAVPGWACQGSSMGHVYRRPGRYTVALTVADRAGRSVSGRIPITIRRAPPWTVFTAVRALGSSVATSSEHGGVVASTLILPSRATSVVGAAAIAGCAHLQACVSAGRRLLGRVGRRNVNPGAVVLRVRATDGPLLHTIRRALRSAHQHTLSATFTIDVKLTHRGPVRIVQHVTLRF